MKHEPFLANASAIQSNWRSRSIIWIIASTIIFFVVWAANAPLDEVVRGSGRVVPKMNTQAIQNLEGGILQQLFVTEGDVVEAGQRVAQMDDTQFLSAFKELSEQRLALMLKLQRLKAEQEIDSVFTPIEELAQLAPEYAASESALFIARRENMSDALVTLSELADLKRQEVAILQPMVESLAVPAIDLVRAEQAAVDAEGQVASLKNEFQAQRAEEYSDTLSRLRQIEEQLFAREDQLRRTDVITPVHGIVNRVASTTIGGVIRPGDTLIEILPLDKPLRIEGRVDPRDIGFVFVGMPATVKLTAFDFSVYGTLAGNVVHVGADTVTDETQREPAPYYEVYIELTSPTLYGPAGEVDIRPGMLAEIELESGTKTVLEYLLKPLFKATEAFSER